MENISPEMLTKILQIAGIVLAGVITLITPISLFVIKRSFETGKFFHMIDGMQSKLADIVKELSNIRALCDAQREHMNGLEGRIIALEVRVDSNTNNIALAR